MGYSFFSMLTLESNSCLIFSYALRPWTLPEKNFGSYSEGISFFPLDIKKYWQPYSTCSSTHRIVYS
jgi:hypothetical protein